MNQTVETIIKDNENKLKAAMLKSDVSALDKLLSDDLIFTNHMGYIMTKQDDIEAHKSKVININEITLTEQQINVYDNIAVVTVKANIIGEFDGKESNNYFRFTRVWRKTSNKLWQIITAHASVINLITTKTHKNI